MFTPTRRTTSERSLLSGVLLRLPLTRRPNFDFFGTRRFLGARESFFGARGVGGEAVTEGELKDVSMNGSPKPGAEPAAVGAAEIRRIVGIESRWGEVGSWGEGVRS